MTCIRPRETYGQPRTSKLTAERPSEYEALLRMTDRCEWCSRRRKLAPHHVAQGFRKQTQYMIRLIALLCLECHNAAHELKAEHSRALGLAIVYHSGRGNNLELLWEVTERRWPSAELVELWIFRVCRVEAQKPSWRE